jgi:hypothetical protein
MLEKDSHLSDKTHLQTYKVANVANLAKSAKVAKNTRSDVQSKTPVPAPN